MVVSCTDSSHDLLRSCLIWRKTLTPLNSYRKRVQEGPNTHCAMFAHSSVTTSSRKFHCLPIYLLFFSLNSVFFPQSAFLLSALTSSPCSCDVCRPNPALKNSLCSFSTFCGQRKKVLFTKEDSHMCCLPPITVSLQISAKAWTCILAGCRAGSIATANSFELPTSYENFQVRKPFNYSLCAYAA